MDKERSRDEVPAPVAEFARTNESADRAAVAASASGSEVKRLAANDAQELAEMLADWDLDLRQLHPGKFTGEVVVVSLGPLLIVRGRFNQSLLQYTSSPTGYVNIARPALGGDPHFFCGHQIENGEVFLAGSHSEAETLNRGLHMPTSILMRVDFLESQTSWLGEAPMAPRGTVRLYTPGTDWTTGFLQNVEWILDAAGRYSEALGRADVCGSVVDAVLARVGTLAAARISNDREMRAARRAAVSRARKYIDAHLTEPIRLSQLCGHARTQERTLEYGFREATGLSPVAYIRTMRLHQARRLLRSTQARTRSVSEIAMDCGFWHLSNFAVNYKAFFGESPSATRKRTRMVVPKGCRTADISS